MQQKTLLKNFCHLNPQDWTLLFQQNDALLVNNHTSDEFIYERINSNSWHLLDIYKSRAQYVMPQTPQIILPHSQSDNLIIQMFVQSAPFTLEKLIKRNTPEATVFQLLKTVIKAIESLVKKFGLFKVTQRMIRVTKAQNIMVWVHQHFSSTHRQLPLSSKNIYEDYKIMIKDILNIFESSGCKKQIQQIKIKIQNQKLLSFQRFKMIIQSQGKMGNKSKEKAIKLYQSPQFLKKRNNSPDLNSHRSATQNFNLGSKLALQNRFITSQNLGSNFNAHNSSSSSSVSKREQALLSNLSQSKQQSPLLNSFQVYSPVNKRTKSMFVMLTHPPKLQPSISSKAESQTTEQIPESQLTGLSEVISMKKKNFRDSGNSVATTAFMNSMTSSGKLRFANLDDHNHSSTASLLKQTQKPLTCSLGMKQKNKIKQIKQVFKVKASRIIQQNSEQVGTPNSFIKYEKQAPNIRQSEVQRDFNDILQFSQTKSKYRPSSDILQLENQINMILLG